MLHKTSASRLSFIVQRASTSTARSHYHRRGFAWTALGAIIGSTAVWYCSSRPILNEVDTKARENPTRKKTDPNKLHSLVWGSNKNGALSPDTSKTESIRTPAVTSWLDGVALRDLRLHDSHAACVDVRGDVYQWGDGFFGTTPSESTRVPKRTLRGKNIVQLQLTDDKVFALSASGRIYVLASSAVKQVLSPGVTVPASYSWRWLSKGDQSLDFAEVTPAEGLGWGESFTSIVAGKNHLLALTTKGRVFAHPVNKLANHFGQLGFRKFGISDPLPSQVTKTSSLNIELVPKSLADPYINSSRAVRPISTSENVVNVDDKDIRFCTNLFEIPVLRGVEAVQIAAGSRTSFMRTKSGRVLAWGANDFGQLGLGSNVPLDTIVVPTEVVLWRFVPNSTESKCLDVTAGGDLTAFVVERKSPDNPTTTTDLLMSGNGQYGGLGNSAYSSSQGNPTRVKGLSGLLQYNDQTKCLEPIVPADISISPTGHVLVSLNSSTGVGGNDLMVWGKNYESELGNGKKASIAQPVAVESERERLMLTVKRAKEVKDLQGRLWKTGVWVQQRAIAGPQNSVVYWKVVL